MAVESKTGNGAAIPSKSVDTDAAVEKWYRESLTNSPASRHTEVWNYLQSVKPALKARLKGD